jgi:hypothetical protein
MACRCTFLDLLNGSIDHIARTDFHGNTLCLMG